MIVDLGLPGGTVLPLRGTLRDDRPSGETEASATDLG